MRNENKIPFCTLRRWTGTLYFDFSISGCQLLNFPLTKFQVGKRTLSPLFAALVQLQNSRQMVSIYFAVKACQIGNFRVNKIFQVGYKCALDLKFKSREGGAGTGSPSQPEILLMGNVKI
jgi:hypothetical protein